MNRKIQFSFLIGLLTSISSAIAQTPAELDNVRNALKLLDSKLARYSVNVTETARREIEGKFIDTRTEYFFVRDNEKCFCDGTTEGMPPATRRVQASFDGKVTTKKIGNQNGWTFGMIDEGTELEFKSPRDFIDTTGGVLISDLLDPSQRHIDIRQDQVVISTTSEMQGTTFKSSLILECQKYCALKSQEMFFRSGDDANWLEYYKIECLTSQEIEPGLFLPTKCRLQEWRKSKENETGVQPRVDATLQFSNWNLNPVIGQDTFQIKFPGGLMVQDRRPGHESSKIQEMPLDEEIATHFEIQGTPLERFEKACRQAKLGTQRILMYFADPTAQSTREFMKIRMRDELVLKALEGFRVMSISTGEQSFLPAKELADKLNISFESNDGVGYFCVVEPDGTVLAKASADEFNRNGTTSRSLVLDFLAENSIKPFDAQALLDDALSRAKAENKRVIVDETATWCGPCWRLAEFLDRTQQIWEKDYILVKMDHRWDGAVKIMEKIRNEAEGGIPWFAILDSDGNVLTTSNGADDDNVGFPVTDAEKTHFKKMISETKIRMTDEQIDQLMKSLDEK